MSRSCTFVEIYKGRQSCSTYVGKIEFVEIQADKEKSEGRENRAAKKRDGRGESGQSFVSLCHRHKFSMLEFICFHSFKFSMCLSS